MKRFLEILLLVVFSLAILYWFAQQQSIPSWESNPQDLIDTLKDDIQATKPVQQVSQWGTIKDTLKSFSQGLNYYINWIIFFALSIATILLMLNGIQLMISISWGKEWDISKFKTRFKNIFIWVAIILGFSLILKIVIAALNAIF